CQQGYYTPWTF
nr:immunoglobulin light chain junction region [Macaca mulatta]MOV79211.1 immunoglobulin light chain junction region [Macaca mulatta]MOV80774.1 immunoglobulin light chain junction region [Macaca mulatta]MOV84476.1 immunoglobulin light chain junction region [Macaca mulatta]